VLIELFSDRVLMRLVAWALPQRSRSERGDRAGQLGRLIDGMAARLAATGAAIRRDRLDFQSLR